MAQEMRCDGCEGAEPAVMLLTNLDTGDVVALGPTCLPLWASSIAETLTADDDAPIGHTPTDPDDPDGDDDEPDGGHAAEQDAPDPMGEPDATTAPPTPSLSTA